MVQREIDARLCVKEWKSKVGMGLRNQFAKDTISRRPDLVLEGKVKQKIWFCYMTCPQQVNIKGKRNKKYSK